MDHALSTTMGAWELPATSASTAHGINTGVKKACPVTPQRQLPLQLPPAVAHIGINWRQPLCCRLWGNKEVAPYPSLHGDNALEVML